MLTNFVTLVDHDRQALAIRASQNAMALGLSPEEWQRRRLGNPTVRDLILALDPEGERARHGA